VSVLVRVSVWHKNEKLHSLEYSTLVECC